MAPPDHDDPRLSRLLAAGALGAGAVHELCNTLAIASSSLFLARRHRADEARLLAQLDRASAAITQAQQASEAILSLARGEPLPTEPTPLLDLLAAARSLSLIPSEFSLSETITPPGLLALAHPILLPQALAQLYKNSIQAQQHRGALRVRASRLEPEHRQVELLLEDDGPGIPEHLRPTLFEPLASADPSGTGLGLTVVRAILEAHGGSVQWLPSPRGALFSLRLLAP
jgi:two-component system C4-dicarboxylate transport sensor histidine kinase DctB